MSSLDRHMGHGLGVALLLTLWACDVRIASSQGAAPAPKQNTPAEKMRPPPANPSEQLDRSGGVIRPPSDVDPGMQVRPPDPGPDSMPVIPPPGTPGGNPNVVPK